MGVFAQEGKVKPGIRPASSPANVHIDYSKLKGSLTPGRTFDIPFSIFSTSFTFRIFLVAGASESMLLLVEMLGV